MGGRIKPAKSPVAPYVKRLDAIEAALAKTTDAEALGKLGRDAHMVGYELGHDIPAIMAMPEIVGRATRAKLAAYESAATASATAGDIKRAVAQRFSAIEAWPPLADMIQMLEGIAAHLDAYAPEGSARMRTFLAELPADDESARAAFARELGRLQHAFDWNLLPSP